MGRMVTRWAGGFGGLWEEGTPSRGQPATKRGRGASGGPRGGKSRKSWAAEKWAFWAAQCPISRWGKSMGKRQENRDKEDKIARLYSKRMLAPGAAAMNVQKQLSQELRIPPKTLRKQISRASMRLEGLAEQLDDDDDDDDDGVVGLAQLRRTEVDKCTALRDEAAASGVSKRGASRAEEDRIYKHFQMLAIPAGVKKCDVEQQLSTQLSIPVRTLRKKLSRAADRYWGHTVEEEEAALAAVPMEVPLETCREDSSSVGALPLAIGHAMPQEVEDRSEASAALLAQPNSADAWLARVMDETERLAPAMSRSALEAAAERLNVLSARSLVEQSLGW